MAAGALLVQEAGGTVTAVDGGPYDPFVMSISASNGRIHQLMVDVIREARIEP
jgi:myo-inositol-1(or 4)-monophosphatase